MKDVVQFCCCAAALYSFFIPMSLLQERIATHHYDVGGGMTQQWRCPLLLTWVSSVIGMCVAGAVIAATHDGPHAVRFVRMPWFSMGSLSLTYVAGQLFGYRTMEYLPYTVALSINLCRMVPTLVIGFCWYGERYRPLQYVAAACITVGDVAFSVLAARQSLAEASAGSSLAGLVFGLCTLVCDGYTSATQDAVRRHARPSSMQMMVATMTCAVLWQTAALVGVEFVPENALLKRELVDAVMMISTNPDVLRDIIVLGVLGSLGQCVIFVTLHRFGALAVLALMLTRKFCSVFVSIWLFGHSTTAAQYVAMGVMFVGVVAETKVVVERKLMNIPMISPKRKRV
jgi:drug/metabolite transporter (DMT)-like permease